MAETIRDILLVGIIIGLEGWIDVDPIIRATESYHSS